MGHLGCYDHRFLTVSEVLIRDRDLFHPLGGPWPRSTPFESPLGRWVEPWPSTGARFGRVICRVLTLRRKRRRSGISRDCGRQCHAGGVVLLALCVDLHPVSSVALLSPLDTCVGVSPCSLLPPDSFDQLDSPAAPSPTSPASRRRGFNAPLSFALDAGVFRELPEPTRAGTLLASSD